MDGRLRKKCSTVFLHNLHYDNHFPGPFNQGFRKRYRRRLRGFFKRKLQRTDCLFCHLCPVIRNLDAQLLSLCKQTWKSPQSRCSPCGFQLKNINDSISGDSNKDLFIQEKWFQKSYFIIHPITVDIFNSNFHTYPYSLAISIL